MTNDDQWWWMMIILWFWPTWFLPQTGITWPNAAWSSCGTANLATWLWLGGASQNWLSFFLTKDNKRPNYSKCNWDSHIWYKLVIIGIICVCIYIIIYILIYIYTYIYYIYIIHIMYIWYIESMFYLAPLSFFLVGSLTGAKSHIFSVFSGYGLAGTFPDRIK